MLRSLLLTALVRLGHNETINEGVRRFHIFFEDGKTSLLPPDTRKVIVLTVFPYIPSVLHLWFLICNVVQAAYLAVMRTVSTSSRSGFDALLKIYREASEPQEKSRVLGLCSPFGFPARQQHSFLFHHVGYPESNVSLFTGSLSSSPDQDIVLEALNFMFTDEVNL